MTKMTTMFKFIVETLTNPKKFLKHGWSLLCLYIVVLLQSELGCCLRHVNSSRLFWEFSHKTFAQHLCECRTNFHVLGTSHELVANMFKTFEHVQKFHANFLAKMSANPSQDCRAAAIRQSRYSLEK